MAKSKWHYLNPRTSTKPIRLEDYVEREVQDRRWNSEAWVGDSARRKSTKTSVTEDHRAWVAKQEKKINEKALAEKLGPGNG